MSSQALILCTTLSQPLCVASSSEVQRSDLSKVASEARAVAPRPGVGVGFLDAVKATRQSSQGLREDLSPRLQVTSAPVIQGESWGWSVASSPPIYQQVQFSGNWASSPGKHQAGKFPSLTSIVSPALRFPLGGARKAKSGEKMLS